MMPLHFLTIATLATIVAVTTTFAAADFEAHFTGGNANTTVAKLLEDSFRTTFNERIEFETVAKPNVQDLAELDFWRSWQYPTLIGDRSYLKNHAQIIGPERHQMPERWPLPLPIDP